MKRTLRDKTGALATVTETAKGWLVRYPDGRVISVSKS